MVEIQGYIERITYNSEETGFTVFKVKAQGQSDLVSVVGTMISPMPGEVIHMKGEWIRHPKYGEQFKILQYKTLIPATVNGIRKYLGSGLIKGIGPVMASRIVDIFGEKTLDVIENETGKLSLVEGIGEKRIEMIRAAWEEQKEIREVMIFLQAHGVSSTYATKIFKHYGDNSISVVKENPYRLASDIMGIGFITADKIAQKLGFEKNTSFRVEAGILYVLNKIAEDGHVYYPYEKLIDETIEMLEVEKELVINAITVAYSERKIIIERISKEEGEDKAVYLTQFHVCELGISNKLKILRDVSSHIPKVNSNEAIEFVQKTINIALAKKQIEAIKSILEKRTPHIITGGPGVGKTTIINVLIKIFLRYELNILLAAPTGRAAKRMNETSGHTAKTIHRLLEYSMQSGGFSKNDKSPLNCDVLIIDESSMIDTVLMYHLLKAVLPGTILILVGDMDQLPSVGSGNVLKDIINSKVFPVIELNEIFRQAKESRIIVASHQIRRGFIPKFEADVPKNDLFFIEKEDPEQVLKIIIELVKERIPKKFGFDSVSDIQVLTPMNKGTVGAINLNMSLQENLNPNEVGITRGARNFRINDKVMQIKNNYDKEVFNGDIGKIIWINSEDQKVFISFDERQVIYDYSDLDEVVLAYAVSVHKSQGSEYPAIVIPILTQHYMLLQRNLIYTAITRGKKLVVIVGTKKALAIAIKNDKVDKRYTYLKERLLN
ncbi:MAG: ATP-dependent RecD-like DNA helicase [Desulfobacterales bacterium]|nr:ATP-dependent RecD-like DNA helicase [Desulfobacterales bacterium]MBF0398365.1 ATP-dependent RecD-like DNA helicase [Desulfobacterales bacterium]